MRRPTRRLTRRQIAVATLGAAILVGCSSAAQPPGALLTLPSGDAADRAPVGGTATSPPTAPGAFPTDQVELRVGQRLLVATVRSDLPEAWLPGTVADSHVVRQDPEKTVHGCSPDVAGCEADVDEVYTAVSAGSTTVSWTYEVLGCQSARPGPPPHLLCVKATKAVHITVTA
ncbi:hypothetical protein ABH930_001380 [Kitasatospora sp. GAS204A]|nr:hypothetical protein [Kitasatospora sp. GAS204B]